MGEHFERRFPVPYYDSDVRKAYKGAWTYLKAGWENVTIEEPGIVLDVNSLYPWVMATKKLPFGEGRFFAGKYKPDKIYDLYIQMLSCSFELKPGYLPTIQLKKNLSFIPTQYLDSSNGEEVTLCLTSVDLEIFLTHYYVSNIQYYSGWKFKSSDKMFVDYVNYWMEIKIKAEKEKNKAMRTIAKLYLNNLYGKLAKSPLIANKMPYLDDKGVVRFKMMPYENVDPIYVPAAAFITAYAREKTITAAQAVYDRFIYADTDSLHLLGTDIPEGIKVDPYELGAWKHENTFEKARFIRAKSYIEVIGGENHITCAGLPKSGIEQITFDEFRLGYEYPASLKSKAVPGGIILKETTFKIRA